MSTTLRTHYTTRRRGNTSLSRPRKYGTLSTPFLHWKFLKDDSKNRYSATRAVSRRGGGLSARKLAAGLWQLRLNGGGGKGFDLKCETYDELGLEPDVRRVNTMFPSHHICSKYCVEQPDLSGNPGLISSSKHGTHKYTMDGATKWDPRSSRISSDICCFYNHLKLLENEVAVVSTSAMQAELAQARLRIHELEAEGQASKKKVKHLLKKLGEERASWQRREHQKIRAAITDDFERHLDRERRKCQKLEILNSKLLNEVANVKSATKQFKQGYEKEKRARQILESVCNELANKIVDNKAETEAFRSGFMKIQEELDEERRMLQMAEVWREEHVQMKLVDAKLALEDKYCQMNKLITELENFLRSGSATLNVLELKKAELIRQEAKSVNVKHIKEFSYAPPKSSDIYSIYEELKQIEANEREVEECNENTPANDASKTQGANSYFNDYNYQSLQQCSNIFFDDNCQFEGEVSGCDEARHMEGQGSIYSQEGSYLSVNGHIQSENSRLSAREYDENEGHGSPGTQNSDENEGHGSPGTQISEVCSGLAEESKHMASSMSKLSRSEPHNSKCYEIIADDGDRRVLNGKFSGEGTSPRRKSREGTIGHRDFVGQWKPPDFLNPHVTQEIKGGIRWPRVIQKNSLKAKLLEARIESQKAQLRSVLKHKS